MSKSTWTGGKSNWADPGNWSPADVPGAGSDVTIATGDAVASASIGTVNSITDSSYLSFESAGTNAVAAFLDDTGHLYVEGGTILNIGGTLTDSGYLSIGNATLSAPDEVTAASLDNTGKIYLTGSSTNQALLDVAGGAGFGTTRILSSYVRLAGDTAIEFASGEIASLAASAHLGLVGSDAFIEDSTALGSNSALTGLASIGVGALFALHDGASVSTTGTLANDGQVYIDTGGGDGGSSLTLAGALTNSQELGIGNGALSASDEVTATSFDNTGKIQLTGSAANQALLDVTGSAGFGAAGVLTSNVDLSGDSAIEFASGQITSLAGSLDLNGNDAFIEDSTALGSNSALTGLASIGAKATFELENKAVVSTTGSLVNDGNVSLDPGGGDSGSSLTVGGTLTNVGTGSLTIGNATLSGSDEVTAASLDNTGSILLNEYAQSNANQALLDVTAGSAGFGTAGVLSGTVELGGDSAIEFKSGQITSLAASASLLLFGSDAFIEDSTALGSNSALTGLASIGAGATLDLENGASVSTTGALANDGTVDVGGGSSLTVGGALTNSGSISMNGGLLDVTGSAGFGTAGVLSGNVVLNGYFGESAIEFASGEITSLAANAQLLLGGDAFIEDSTALGSNSALTGLANVAGSLHLYGRASVSTTGALTNSGLVNIGGTTSFAGPTLSIAGALTNTGRLDIGFLGSVRGHVTAKSFVNSGTVDLSNLGTLDVSGALTNNGSISIAYDTEELAGAVGGAAGSFSLSTANLQFDSSVSSGQTITETGTDALTLKQAQSFAATISGFGTGDTIDATNFLAPPATTYNFVENSMGTGGTLTLIDTSLTANILMTGVYTKSDFTLAPDSGTGTLVKFA